MTENQIDHDQNVIMQITTSWHEKGRAEGRAERTGEIICKYLTRKFGEKSAGLQQKVVQITELEKLDDILEELFAANTLEDACAIINDVASR